MEQNTSESIAKFQNYHDLLKLNMKRQGVSLLDKIPQIFKNLVEQQINVSEQNSSQQIANLSKMKKELQQMGFSDIKHIGSGSQGCVIVVKETKTGLRYAVKGIRIGFSGQVNQILLNNATKEYQALIECQSHNVVKCFGQFQTKSFYFIKMEECLGTLENLLKQNDKLNEISFIKYARDISFGLEYIHSKNYVVQDIKLENILITYTGNLVFCDLGLGQKLDKGSRYIKSNDGNILFKSPEASFNFYQQKYLNLGLNPSGFQRKRSDYFSLGMILYCMLIGQKDFFSKCMQKDIQLKYFESFSSFQFYEKIKDILLGLTRFIPSERISVREVLNDINYIYMQIYDPCFSLDIISIQNIKNEDVDLIQISNKQVFPIQNIVLSIEQNNQIISSQKQDIPQKKKEDNQMNIKQEKNQNIMPQIKKVPQDKKQQISYLKQQIKAEIESKFKILGITEILQQFLIEFDQNNPKIFGKYNFGIQFQVYNDETKYYTPDSIFKCNFLKEDQKHQFKKLLYQKWFFDDNLYKIADDLLTSFKTYHIQVLKLSF